MEIERKIGERTKIEGLDYGQVFHWGNQYYIVTQWECDSEEDEEEGYTTMAVNLRNGDLAKFCDDDIVEKVNCCFIIE